MTAARYRVSVDGRIDGLPPVAVLDDIDKDTICVCWSRERAEQIAQALEAMDRDRRLTAGSRRRIGARPPGGRR